ncbi:phage tail sheath family protein [Woodsholea maritima]|uniref:phage tail sheath family protein n=1 Tax=Woodsholea maritima TaxID=240237 RepID=UPI000370F8FC|nr:phage tail sheath subtilisin-like domain-containing protein [Woodsholea maritima]
MYKHPGVYIEHVPSGLLAIEAASTSIAAFIGHVPRGNLITANAEEGEPVYITNISQYAQAFGVLNDQAGGIRDGANPDYFGHSVASFFANGGTKAYIVPVGDGNGDKASAALVDPFDNTMAFYFTARSAGVWANDLFIEIERTLDDADPANHLYGINIGQKNEKGEIEALEAFSNLSLNPEAGNYLAAKVEDESALISIRHLDITDGDAGRRKALIGASIASLDLATLTNADQLTLKLNAGAEFTINLAGGYGDLAAIASDIQTKVRAGAGEARTGFTAAITSDKRLLMIPGGNVANPAIAAKGSATALKLGLDPTVHRGRPVGAIDFAALNGQSVTLTVGAKNAVVNLANPANLAAVATQIQDAVRAAPNAVASFSADVVNDRLVMRTNDAFVASAVQVTGGTGAETVGLFAADAGELRPTAVNYPESYNGATNSAETRMAGGLDHGAPNVAAYRAAFIRLRDYRDISIVLTPGHHWIEGGDNSIIEAALAHCEFMQNRLLLIDPPRPTQATKLETPKDIKDLGAPTSPYSALYYPWLTVANPHYDPDTAANKPKTVDIPPSSFAAGLWARTDARRGVWKAPAGLEASVRGALSPTVRIGDDLQDNLNEWGVNCLRSIIGPTVIWGARTLATKTKPEFRYVPVRRTQSMIGESLYGALQTVVFEPNDHKLWSALKAAAATFMESLHRAGAFQPAKASEAFYVQCGLGETMTQGDIDGGIVRLVVGFAPLKPAEFVVVQIKQIVGRSA